MFRLASRKNDKSDRPNLVPSVETRSENEICYKLKLLINFFALQISEY